MSVWEQWNEQAQGGAQPSKVAALLTASVSVLIGTLVAITFWLWIKCDWRCSKGELNCYKFEPQDGCICEGKDEHGTYLMRPPVLSGEREIRRAGEDR